MGAYGMTRCGANNDFICLQRHQDGQFLFTDGTTRLEFWISASPHTLILDGAVPEAKAVATAVAVIGRGFGIAILIEDYGLVFIQTFSDVPTMSTLHESDKIETTIGTDSNYVAIADGDTILMFDVAQNKPPTRIPVPGLDLAQQERIWQLDIAQDLIGLCTTETVKWYHNNDRAWKSSDIASVVAVKVNAKNKKVSVLTALGDVVSTHYHIHYYLLEILISAPTPFPQLFPKSEIQHQPYFLNYFPNLESNPTKIIVDSNYISKARRLEKGSEIQPFVSQHTRDGIFAWGTLGIYDPCMRMIKAGGEVHQVNL